MIRWTLVCTVALALAGCGQRAATPAQQARDAVRVFLDACAHDEPLAATELLTEPARQTFLRAPTTTAGCLAATNLDLRGASDAVARRALQDARVTVTHLHGVYAVALIAAPGGGRGGTQLDDVGGDWQLAGAID